MLSSRRSSITIRFSPVTPFRRWARVKKILNCFSSMPYMRFTFCFSRSWKE